MKETEKLENLDADWKILNYILKYRDRKVWTGLILLRIGASSELF
jgi:macrodomain Ter protein organizer (MatP/YcbG family)